MPPPQRIAIHKITHHTVLSDGKTPHGFMASSVQVVCRPAMLYDSNRQRLVRSDRGTNFKIFGRSAKGDSVTFSAKQRVV